MDCDILLYGSDTIENTRLTVPHYGLKAREFVLLPLNEIAPSLIIPSGESVSVLAQEIDSNGITKLCDVN